MKRSRGSAAWTALSSAGLVLLWLTACDAAPSRPPAAPAATEPSQPLPRPHLSAAGNLRFSVADIDAVRTLVEATAFPISEATLTERLGFPLASLRRSLMVMGGGGVARNFLLSERCSLKIGSDQRDEIDTLYSAEVLCSDEETWGPGPPRAPEYPDLASALAAVGLRSQDRDDFPPCGGLLAGFDPALVECRRVDADHVLLLQTTPAGVAVVYRRHVE